MQTSRRDALLSCWVTTTMPIFGGNAETIRDTVHACTLDYRSIIIFILFVFIHLFLYLEVVCWIYLSSVLYWGVVDLCVKTSQIPHVSLKNHNISFIFFFF